LAVITYHAVCLFGTVAIEADGEAIFCRKDGLPKFKGRRQSAGAYGEMMAH
jgi:hypothetical protein